MKKKNHLTWEQRYEISALLQAGHSQKEIAELTGKDKSDGRLTGYAGGLDRKVQLFELERYLK